MFDIESEIFKFNRGQNRMTKKVQVTPLHESKPIVGLEDNNQPPTTSPTGGSSDPAIFEYREPSKQAQQYCPVYCDGTDATTGGKVYRAYISGQINEVDSYLALIDTLLIMSNSDKIIIFIDSPGGYVASGGLVASAIAMSHGEVTTIARGLCASAAALIHSAAPRGKALVTPYAVMLYHMSSHADQGVSTKVLSAAEKQVKYVNETLLSKAKEDGYITDEEFNKIQQGEDIIVPANVWLERSKGGVNE